MGVGKFPGKAYKNIQKKPKKPHRQSSYSTW